MSKSLIWHRIHNWILKVIIGKKSVVVNVLINNGVLDLTDENYFFVYNSTFVSTGVKMGKPLNIENYTKSERKRLIAQGFPLEREE